MDAWITKAQLLAATSLMGDTFTDSSPDKRFALLIVLIGCGTGVLCTAILFVTTTINSMHRRNVEAKLKVEMLERGMSAGDVATVIEAATPPEDGTQRWIASWAKKSKSA